MKTIMNLVAASALSVAILHPAVASVANDNFADAIALLGDSGTESVSNTDATQEEGETALGANSKCTVWYKWTAPQRGTMTVDTLGSDFDTLIAAYTGTEFGDFVRVALNDDYSGRLSRMQFIAESGVTYFILAGGYSTNTGNLALNWEFVDGTFEMIVTGEAVTGYRGICPSALDAEDWPEGVTMIAERAFANASVESVTVPEGVTNISSYAFYYCRSLQRISIPSTVKTIGQNTFAYCYALTDVVMAEGVENLVGWTFQGCSSLETIVIPSTVSRIGSLAFHNCSRLMNVTFAGGRDSVEMYVLSVFEGTPWKEAQPFELITGSYNELQGFLGICPETVIIPEGVRTIWSAFSIDSNPSVTNLVNVSLPSSLGFIGASAFYGCCKLESIYVPQGVYSVERGAIYGCSSLQQVSFEDGERAEGFYAAFKGTPFFDTLPFSLRFEWRSNDEETWKPYVVDYVGRCPAELDIEAVHVAQWEADRQRELELYGYDIGDAPLIEGIAVGVFQSCDIKSVVLPASLSVIENGAFVDCTNLTRVVFSGNAPEEISEYAFNVYIPGHYNEWDGWVEPYDGPNTNCTVYVPATSTGWGVDIPGEWMGMPIRYSAAGIVEDGVLVSVSLGGDTEYTVPAGVTNIAANAFSGCGDLERVVIPDAVTSIDRTAFDGCGKLWAKWYKSMANGAADAASAAGASEIALTVTNVVVHYVTQSVQSDAVVPSAVSGIVNIFGEVVAGSTVVIPSAWAEQYPGFAAKFGSDFTAALTKPTGKRDGAGTAMQVWQDFVAGTDPTDPEDVFKASITFDKSTNEPIISWTPELSEAEAAKRIYRINGKVRLTDADWSPVNGNASDYNFFRVSVEMK